MTLKHKTGVKFLPTNLAHVLPNLIQVHVYKCSVTSVQGNHFKGLSKLKFLLLEYNEIEHVASDAFATLVNLKELFLHSNKIRVLHKDTFASLKKLRKLNLADNKIENLHPEIFKSLWEIESIDLHMNSIHGLDGKIFDNLPSLRSVDVSGIGCIHVVGSTGNLEELNELRMFLKKYCNESSSQLVSKVLIFLSLVVTYVTAS